MLNAEVVIRRGVARSAAWCVLMACSVGCTAADDDAAATNAILRGRVVDAAGKPVAGATVRVNRCGEARPLDFRALRVQTNEQGRYEMTVRWVGGARLRLAEIVVTHASYVSGSWQEGKLLSPGDDFTIDFRLQPGEVFAGRIERPLTAMEKRAGLSNKTNRFRFTISNATFEYAGMTDPGGRFEVQVPAGVYTIRVLEPPLIRNGIEAPARDLHLRPAPVEITPARLTAAFDALWGSMDRSYSYFALKEVDWRKLRGEYRPHVADCVTLSDFVNLLRDMLAHLEDLHVWVDTPDGVIGTYERPWQRNWSPKYVRAALAEWVDCGEFAIVGRTREGYGVLIIARQSAATPAVVQQTLVALGKLRGAPGFIVDLRGGCSGGSEALAREIATFFCEKDVVYAASRQRQGAAHTDLSPPAPRTLAAGDDPYVGPVVCLIGGKCMSSGEALVQMMSALPHVTTIGMRTRGASGNPRPFALPDLPIHVWYSRWVDLMPDGTPIEDMGIAPDITLSDPVSAYADDDPTWRRAVKVLQEGANVSATTTQRVSP